MPKGKEVIEIFRGAAKVDSLDDDTRADPAPHHTEPGCTIWPRTSEEVGKGEVVIEGLNVFTRKGADVLASDRVKARGETYAVDGVPGDYGKGLMVVLKRLGSS